MQDFTRKITVFVRRDLPEWQILNTVAHVSAYFGNALKDSFSTGESFNTKDGIAVPRNCQYGIVIFQADKEQLVPLVQKAKDSDVMVMGFTKEMLESEDDNEIQEQLSKLAADEIEYFGVGVFGDKEILKTVTKGLSLWK